MAVELNGTNGNFIVRLASQKLKARFHSPALLLGPLIFYPVFMCIFCALLSIADARVSVISYFLLFQLNFLFV